MRGSQDKMVKREKASPKERSALYDALLSLKNRDETAAFLRDLCTVAELDAMAERLAIAKRVMKEDRYRTIAEALGASTTTVTRVAHWLQHGTGGYRTVISRIT